MSKTAYLHIKKKGNHLKVTGLPTSHLGDKLDFASKYGPEGIFAEWNWDGSSLNLRNDRYGFYPLYYFIGPDEIAISTSIPKLAELGAPLDLDDTALAVFLRIGFFIDSDTPFKEIKAVPPCSVFQWEDGELRIEEEWPTSGLAQINREEAIDKYIDLFSQSIRRRLPQDKNFAVPISGGRDSRHILLELVRTGHNPEHCVTARYYPDAPSSDVEVTDRLTTALNLPHIVLNQPESRFQSELRKNILTNFCADEHTWYLAVAYYLKGRTSAVYDGIGGDVLSAGLFLTRERLELYTSNRLEDLALNLWTEDKEKTLARLLPPEQYRRFSRDRAINHLVKELKRHVNAPNQVGAFYFANRTRREIVLSIYSILDNAGQIYTPYLDHDLYDFLTSLPAEIFLDHNFHTDTIKKAYPDFKDIPYSKKPVSQIPRWRYFQHFAAASLRYTTKNHNLHSISDSYIFPHLLRCLIDKKYSPAIEWFAPMAIYLIQINNVKDR